MKREEFSHQSPGMLVAIEDGLAFLPAPLPPNLSISRTLLNAVEQARGALSEFVGQARVIDNINLIMAPLQRREAVLSSRIEGTQTEVRELLRAEASPAETPDQDSDLYEVMNYLRALEYGQSWVAEGRPLNLSLVRGLHTELMRGVRGRDKSPGAFRSRQVYIGDRIAGLKAARFVPPPPEQIPSLVDNLLSFAGTSPHYSSLIDCAIIHYQFESIHPFEDGNGRLGRLLIPLFLLSEGVIDRPILYVSPFFEEHRDNYLELLKHVSTQGAWEEWVLFFLEAVRSQAENSRLRVQRIAELRARYNALVAQSTRAVILSIDFIMERVVVTVPQLAEHTGTTYPTARAAIETLVKLSVLVPGGRNRGRQEWVAEELLREVYES